MQNLHTHTIYCDGVNVPEELIKEAMRRGFDSIGFSGHSYMKREPREYSMTAESNLLYRKKVQELKIRYANALQIFLGMEADFYSEADRTGYDYLIGSVHYVEKAGRLIDFDRTDIGRPSDTMKHVIQDIYKGKGMDFVRDYYETLARLPERGKTDIIGHFDLITKFDELDSSLFLHNTEYKRIAEKYITFVGFCIKCFNFQEIIIYKNRHIWKK